MEKENKIFNKVKNSLKKIKLSLPSKEKKDTEILHKHQNVVSMNVPALLARRISAYNRAVDLLNTNIFSLNQKSRVGIYDAILHLLDDAIKSTQDIIYPSKKINEDENTSPILMYFQLLYDTINAAYSLAKHEIVLHKDEKELTGFMGKDITSQIQSTDAIFLESERHVHSAAIGLITASETSIKKYSNRRIKHLSSENLVRFQKATSEFRKLYDTYGVKSKKSILSTQTIDLRFLKKKL